MVLDIGRAYAHVGHVLFGNVPSGVSKLRLVNEAGSHLVQMHRWWFLERPPATIALVDGQVEYTLASDYGEWVASEATNSLVNSLSLVSPQHLINLETNQIEVTQWGYYGAIFYKQTVAGRAPVPVLRVWPTPSTDQADSFTYVYRAKWVDMDEDSNQYAQIPPFAETLYLQILGAFAQGYVKENEGSLDERLELIRRGPVFRSAVITDGQQQHTLGPLVNGAIQNLGSGYSRVSRTIVPGPI